MLSQKGDRFAYYITYVVFQPLLLVFSALGEHGVSPGNLFTYNAFTD